MAELAMKKPGAAFSGVFENFGALAFTGLSAVSAVGTGLPVLQVASAALLPGSFMAIRTTWRSVKGVAQAPVSRGMRFYSVASAAIMTPLVNAPQLAEAGLPAIATAAAAAAGLGYGAYVGTSRKALAGRRPTSRVDRDTPAPGVANDVEVGLDNIFDLSPGRKQTVLAAVMSPKPQRSRKPGCGAPQGVPGRIGGSASMAATLIAAMDPAPAPAEPDRKDPDSIFDIENPSRIPRLNR